ncbi:NAD-dependent succinate-semialdehyde dehydrogenase [Actinomadura mexicana]|uniref:NAD-dependent succinate-semialdehyde dehydrogenase n=1 Tax=Actinomadura mexicana TaxID=134959 RepID=UPI000B792354
MPVVADEGRVVADVPSGLLIGGAWVEAGDGATLQVEDPATGEILGRVADAAVGDGAAALDAADRAFGAFRTLAPRRRSEILRRAYELTVERTEQLALLMTLEMGKPLAEARAEVAYAANFLRWYAEEAVRVNGRFTSNETGQGRVFTFKQAVGPCLLITPWNFPLAMGARKIAPAVAAGCTMVVKPAAQTPFSMLALAQILTEAGLPDGVLNVITTSSSGRVMEPLIRDPRVRKLSFTGSTEVGRRLIAQAAEQVLKVSMELGGNAAFVVFDDADIDLALDGAMLAKMRNGGEACTSANRFYVQDGVAEQFAERLAQRMEALVVGRGTGANVDVGPLIDEAQRTKVDELVTEVVSRGAEVLTGGRRIDGPGYFYQPTVLAGVPDQARVLHEEIFGPVAPIVPFSDTGEVISKANGTEYGLVSYLFTRDIDRAFHVTESLESGMVGLNQGIVSNAGAPFGGVKQSGFGREGGPEGLEEYLETKYVAMNVGGPLQ